MIRKPSRAPSLHERGGVELRELEVGEVGAGRVGQRQADADRARRVGGARPQRGRAAGGQHGAARGDRRAARLAARPRHADAAAVVAPAAPIAVVCSNTSIRSWVAASAASWRVMRRPVAAAAGVHDPARRVAALEPEGERRRGGRRRSARPAPGARAPGRGESSHSTSHGARAGGAAAGGERVLRRGARASRRPPARRRCRPGPSSWRSPASGERETSATRAPSRAATSAQKSPAAPAPTTVTSARSWVEAAQAPMRGYGNAIAAPLYFRHPASLEHDTGAASRAAPTASARSRRRSSDRDWLGYERARGAARPTEEQLAARASREPRRRACASTARRRGRSTSTPRPARARGRPRCTRRAAACALVEALLAGEAPTGFCGAAPAGPPRRARPRDGLLPVLQRRGRRAPRARLARRRARAGARLGRAPRQRHQRDLPLLARGAVRQHPPVAVLSRHRRARATRGRAPGEGFTINLPVPAGAGEDEWLGLVEHVVVPAAREFRPDLILVSAGFDAHRDDPLAECRAGDRRASRSLGRACARSADELGVPGGARARGRLRPRRAGRLGGGDDGGAGGGRRAAARCEPGPLVRRPASRSAATGRLAVTQRRARRTSVRREGRRLTSARLAGNAPGSSSRPACGALGGLRLG